VANSFVSTDHAGPYPRRRSVRFRAAPKDLKDVLG
jgi:hypothetical protein